MFKKNLKYIVGEKLLTAIVLLYILNNNLSQEIVAFFSNDNFPLRGRCVRRENIHTGRKKTIIKFQRILTSQFVILFSSNGVTKVKIHKENICQ